jgi:apoptosis-inducing factor 3
MAEDETNRNNVDLAQGIPLDQLPDGGRLVGHFNDEDVLLVRSGDEIFAVSPHCTHYNGPLAEGLVVGDTVRCPWHHACFDLRTGEALRAPALSPIACWEVEQRDGTVRQARAEKAKAAQNGRGGAPKHCHHRRRRGRICGG